MEKRKTTNILEQSKQIGLFALIFVYINHRLVGFYGMSTIVGYLMQNPVYTYILDIFDLVWLDFMAYQPL